jgi:hypothetical protein
MCLKSARLRRKLRFCDKFSHESNSGEPPPGPQFWGSWIDAFCDRIIVEFGVLTMLDKLFGKRQPPQPTQAQTFGDVTLNGGQMSVAQAGGDLVQSQSGENAGQQQDITGTQVIALLEQLRGAIEASGLTADQKEELQDYLKAAKREAGKESPDKELIGKNLKNVGETMKNLKETTEAGKSLWQTGTEVFKAIAPWVGVATTFFGI